MEHPALDLIDRSVIWDHMQMLWMDVDPAREVEGLARICARSKYSMSELEAIFWNEVRPAVSFNMTLLPAPEWTGFEIEWLKTRILEKHRFGARLPWKFLHPYSSMWWFQLRHAIQTLRAAIN
ncbi:MAG: hypothetical protein KDI75_02530 [Xanthomonadales bacterium]|nr:hypothetical protein [Xanthomonadales bacterium]